MPPTAPASDPIYRPLTLGDYEAAGALWSRTEMMGLGVGDDRDGIARYLERNPGLSHVAVAGGELVGTLLAGHDGRRGWLHHLAVDRAWRRRGIAHRLTEICLARLADEGMTRVHLMIYSDNLAGQEFWRALGWKLADGVVSLMTIDGDRPADPPSDSP